MNALWRNAALICLSSLMFMTMSCGNDEPQHIGQAEKDVALSISAEMVKADVAVGRSVISGTLFAAGSYEFGTWVCQHEEDPKDFVPSQTDFNHIHALLTVNGSENKMEFLFRDRPRSVLNVTRNSPIDIYSYYPHLYGSQYYDLKPDVVPFTVSVDEKDWMWAKKSILATELDGDTFLANLQFSHAMTCIKILVKAKYTGSVVSSITLTDTKGRLYTAGWLNLASQTVVLDENSSTNSLNLKFNRGINTETPFYFILPEIPEFEEGELKLSFVMNNVSIDETFTIPAISQTMNDGTEIKGFLKGLCYTYRVSVDNTLTFSPVEIDDEWNTEEYTYHI